MGNVFWTWEDVRKCIWVSTPLYWHSWFSWARMLSLFLETWNNENKRVEDRTFLRYYYDSRSYTRAHTLTSRSSEAKRSLSSSIVSSSLGCGAGGLSRGSCTVERSDGERERVISCSRNAVCTSQISTKKNVTTNGLISNFKRKKIHWIYRSCAEGWTKYWWVKIHKVTFSQRKVSKRLTESLLELFASSHLVNKLPLERVHVRIQLNQNGKNA